MLPLQLSVWAAAFVAFAAGNLVLAYQDQPKIEPGGQVEVQYISDEEFRAFDAAKQEPDPQERASKFYDFVQKYPKSPLVKQIPLKDYANIKRIEDEYNAYYTVRQEPDFEKRGAMLAEFIHKYPQSSLKKNVDYEFSQMLKKASEDKKYELLESLAGKWLSIHANDSEAYAFMAEAAINLQKYEKCGESLEAVFALQSSPALAWQIHTCYQKANNLAKQTEWAAKLFKMSDFAADYMLRYGYVVRFSKDQNLAKAAEYAQLTLKSADLANPQDASTKEQLRRVRRACYHVIGSSLLEKESYSEAISAFKDALKIERYEEGYYKIGLCYDNQKEFEKALPYYAAAELMGGEDASKAKTRLQALYRSLHNDTLIGIEKVYKKGEDLQAEWSEALRQNP